MMLLFLPEFNFACWLLVLIGLGSFQQKNQMLIISLAMFTLLSTVVCLWLGAEVGVSGNVWVADQVALWSKTLCLVVTGLILWLTYPLFIKQKLPLLPVLSLMLLATFGCMVVISAYDMLMLFIGLELIALPSYALCTIKGYDTLASEAALKYFITGVVATAFILYGMSFIYGVSGHIDYLGIGAYLQEPMLMDGGWLYRLGMVFLLAGLAFKLGLVPFHSWVPDVYQAPPLGVVYWIATVPKIAYVIMVVRLAKYVLTSGIWLQIWLCVGLLSVIYGTLMALRQSNVRRLLGYSSIVHMGFISLSVGLWDVDGGVTSLVYLIAYLLMTVTAFSALSIWAWSSDEDVSIASLSGLSRQQPLVSLLMLVALASFAGIPPLVGFIAKLNVFYVLFSAGYIVTAVCAILAVVVGAYYYMNLIRVMYFHSSGEIASVGYSTYVYATLGLFLLVLGIFPQQMLLLCKELVLGMV